MAADPRDDVLRLAEEAKVEIVQLQFTDILGTLKSVSIPRRELPRALERGILFDGSSIEGFVRIEESDMLLRPDPATYLHYSWQTEGARLLCDIVRPDGSPFEGCPRTTLRRQLASAAADGFTLRVGAEPEFFLLPLGKDGRAEVRTTDQAGYFDLSPADPGERARQEIAKTLSGLGFAIEAAHHEVSPGQHEIDLAPLGALEMADLIATFRMVARIVAERHGLHATFMPKPVFGLNGSGLHLHHALWKEGKNAFHDAGQAHGLSRVARHFIAGLMAHAKAITLVANPLVNSYKRLQPGYEAPVHVTWSVHNRSPLIRVPEDSLDTRIELRSPDPACNPYLLLSATLAAGLDGLRRRLEPPAPIPGDMYRLTREERQELGIEELPRNLRAAVRALRQDDLVRAALGEHVARQLIEAKEIEWDIYEAQVHGWEIDQYLMQY